MNAAPRMTSASVTIREIDRRLSVQRQVHYPLTKYEHDPVAYAHERLHLEVLMPHQEEILRAAALSVHGKSKRRIAVSSGQKCGKTLVVIVLALWFYECFGSARVFLLANKEEQIKAVLWRELATLLRHARAKGSDIDGVLAASPTGGLRSTDQEREVLGIAGREIESLAGLSGKMLFIVDEASALKMEKAEALLGNLLGGGSIIIISNPTRVSGPFFDAFHRQKEHWVTFHISGLDVANWQVANDLQVPNAVNVKAIRDIVDMWGIDSTFYIVRVLGQFVRNEQGRVIQYHQIESAADRWADTPEEGPLRIGYDPAGDGAAGDEHAWSVLRGQKQIELIAMTGAKIAAMYPELHPDEAAARMTLDILQRHQRAGENPAPHINIDAEVVGHSIFKKLQAEEQRRTVHSAAMSFTVAGVRSSDKARDARRCGSLSGSKRNELIDSVARWIVGNESEGKPPGAIMRDDRLFVELYVWRWLYQEGPLVAQPKKEVKEQLGRSPDRFDSLALAVYDPPAWASSGASTTRAEPYQRSRGEPSPDGPRSLAQAYGVGRGIGSGGYGVRRGGR